MKKILFICFFVMLLSSNVQQESSPAVAKEGEYNHENPESELYKGKSFINTQSFITRKYILGPNDVISITIYNVPELNNENVRIQPDGKVVITPIGAFKVAGYTIDELQELLIAKYRYILKNPEVSIKLVECRPFIVYVTGAVSNPGSYELNTNTNTSPYYSKPEAYIERKTPLLSNILVAAGGISFDADLEHIQVINELENSKYEVNLLDLLKNGNSKQDIYLMAGDTVQVPRLPTPLAVNEERYKIYSNATFSPHTIPVRVIGYVNNPGLVRLETSESLNLNSAITSAGGYLNDSAYAPNKVFISRSDQNGKLVTRVVNPMNNDVILMPNDIVYIPEKTRPLVGKSFDYLSRIISPFNGFANTYNNWDYMFFK